MGKNNAKMIDPKLFIQAGIDPNTGLPLKLVEGDPENLRPGMKHFLQLIDEQDAINRYKWYNLPCNISGQELERMLHYRGQLAFFYLEDLDEFYFMPYALDGSLDFYGRFNSIHPLPYSGGGGNEKQEKVQREYLSRVKLNCVYSVLADEPDWEDFTKSAVILYDYSKEYGENIIPRANINEPLLNVMAETVPFMRTALINATGIKGVRVNDADQAASVASASKGVRDAALKGQAYVPIVGNIEFQELTDGTTQGKAEEYMLALQSLDNLRLSGYGLDNGGLYEKKAHTLQTEQDMNTNNVGLIYQDGLSIRQNFCNIVNSIWGLGIWCEPSESVLGVDQDGDGAAYDRNDTEQSGSQSTDGGNTDGNNNDTNV